MPTTCAVLRGAALASAFGLSCATPAIGGAFQLNERSAKALGAALSGSASSDADVTFASFNPAALSTVEHIEFGGNASAVLPSSDGTFETGPAAGFSTDPAQGALVAGFSAGMRLTDWLVVGMSSYTPFGLVTDYPGDWPGAADGTLSELLTLQFSPTVAVEPIEGLSIGASLDILYADVRLNSAVTNLKGDDVAFGFTVGVQWEPIAGTRLGAAYHSGFDLETEGVQTNFLLGGATAPLTANASLPGTLLAGVTQSVTEDLRVMGEFRYITWSDFETIEFSSPEFAGTPFADFEDEQNYEDSIFVSIGLEYDWDDRLTVRGGVAFDETPTTDAFRTVRVPDGDRIWISAGASYDLTEHLTVDLAYNYLQAISDPEVTLRNGALAGSVIGYDANVHIVSIGGAMRF